LLALAFNLSGTERDGVVSVRGLWRELEETQVA